MNKRRKLIVGLTCLALAAGVSATVIFRAAGASGGVAVRTAGVMRGDLVETINVTGTVYSRESTEVYSSLSYPVEAVHVQVGDRVEAGDLLAQLDTTDLEYDIAQTRASINAKQTEAQQRIDSAQRALDTYARNSENNLNQKLIDAEGAVTRAELEVQSAASTLRAARKEYREQKDEGDLTDLELTQWRSKISLLEIDLEKYQAALELAERDLEAVRTASADDRITYEEGVESAQVAGNFADQTIALQKMQENLADGTITAPISGTVTAVKAVKGAPAEGLLFVIQDADNLKVVTNIKEYDIQYIRMGGQVDIRADATGDTVFTGTISKIAPTSTTSSTGEMSDTNDAEFETEVSVADCGEMRIGMNARLEIIVDRADDTLYIPYEAIVDTEEGPQVFKVVADGEGGYLAQLVAVEIGLETDFYSEIRSPLLAAGDVVILETEGLEDGVAVLPSAGPVPEASDQAEDVHAEPQGDDRFEAEGDASSEAQDDDSSEAQDDGQSEAEGEAQPEAQEEVRVDA